MSLTLFVSCIEKPRPLNKFSDPAFVKIYDCQDKRQADSLYQFFDDLNPDYRLAAVSAFSSIQDTLAISKLGTLLLQDPMESVRATAALVIGQTGGQQAVQLLLSAIDSESAPDVRREIYEALGKVGDIQSFHHLNVLHSENVDDLTGIAWMLYRFGLRGMTDSTVIESALSKLKDKEENVRLGAAHFFARGKFENPSIEEDIIIEVALHDPSVNVRMAAASGLRLFRSETVAHTLIKIATSDASSDVRINAIRSLSSFDDEKIISHLIKFLADTSVNVSVASSEALATKSIEGFKDEILSEPLNWRVQANLYGSVLRTNPKNKMLTEEIIDLYKKSSSDYQKAALLTALGNSVLAYSFVADQLLDSTAFVVRSSAASALVDINNLPEFPPSLQKSILDIYIKAIANGDPAVIGIITDALIDPSLKYKKLISDWNFLHEAKSKLNLPKDVESLEPLNKAIAYFEDKKYEPTKNAFNHPIDWDYVKSIPKDQAVVVKTTKGDITMKLLVEESPGSVSNFLKLMDVNYFDLKYFHRVVPNFVIQTGCNRGDGWGSEDYSIRSEFTNRRYKRGSVGMASAGKDTEGTQWFITHSPTPHLDGRYTIFAEVVGGMEIVDQIQVGDQIWNVARVESQK